MTYESASSGDRRTVTVKTRDVVEREVVAQTCASGAAGVSLFALSTFDTDTILVSATRLGDARRALVDAGYDLVFDAEN